MSKKKILVIEDDKDIRDTITYALQDKYEVIASESARILKSLNDIKPDIILLDNWLTDWKSDANGQQLSKELKTNSATSHIPVVMVSAVSNIKEVTVAGLADGYLKKPFDLDDLKAIVKKFIG